MQSREPPMRQLRGDYKTVRPSWTTASQRSSENNSNMDVLRRNALISGAPLFLYGTERGLPIL